MGAAYPNARSFFEAAREASIDAEKCQRQLDSMEEASTAPARPTLGPHVMGGGGTADLIGAIVASTLDSKERLEQRIEDDFALIDAANRVLYGEDGIRDGLASIVPAWWADVLWWRYLAPSTWEQVGAALGISGRRAFDVASAALETCDANGMLATVRGVGMAEG